MNNKKVKEVCKIAKLFFCFRHTLLSVTEYLYSVKIAVCLCILHFDIDILGKI